MARALAVTVAVVVLSGCVGHNTRTAERGPSNLLTQEEIAAAPVDDAYAAVSRLRPNFLRQHITGSRTPAYAVVYIDGIRSGTPDVLRTVAARTIIEIRYLTSTDASLRYGLNHPGGVIDVKLAHP